MAQEDIPISTGVDGLVKLVRDKGRIELREASIELGISQGVIEEWAKVLEREGVVKIDYMLTKVYITIPSTEKSEVQKKAREIAEMQVTMSREVESQVKRLERVGRELDEMRDDFIGVSGVFEDRLAAVRQKVRELDALEKKHEELCYRGRCTNEKFMGDIEMLRKKIEESEKKLERLQKTMEEVERGTKSISPPEVAKSDKK
jgi:DNA repair exonuclease SbcCD ATPase subunit